MAYVHQILWTRDLQHEPYRSESVLHTHTGINPVTMIHVATDSQVYIQIVIVNTYSLVGAWPNQHGFLWRGLSSSTETETDLSLPLHWYRLILTPMLVSMLQTIATDHEVAVQKGQMMNVTVCICHCFISDLEICTCMRRWWRLWTCYSSHSAESM